jgi:capsular polysaccharide transport system permease protein
MRRRHWGLIFSLLFFVALPLAVIGWYLQERAVDQYASTLGFSVQRENTEVSTSLLGGLTGTGSGSKDADVLNEYIRSQELVSYLDSELDLRMIWSKPDNDPVFAFREDGSIEDLHSYWNRMVTIYYDASTGLIEVRVKAFEAQDAQDIAVSIIEQSTLMINRLTTAAREDAISFARAELVSAEARYLEARQELQAWRTETQIVDPSSDLTGQTTLINQLESQLAQALIELDLLLDTTRAGDPRVSQAERRITVIEDRIESEREKFGAAGVGRSGEAYAELVNTFEALMVEQDFAQQAYLAARSALEAARVEAQRQSRYLEPHVRPTLAETARYPERYTMFGLSALFLMLIWTIGALIYYSFRDRG